MTCRLRRHPLSQRAAAAAAAHKAKPQPLAARPQPPTAQPQPPEAQPQPRGLPPFTTKARPEYPQPAAAPCVALAEPQARPEQASWGAQP